MGFEKQHIVSQAYLKRFATQNPKKQKVYYWSKG